VTKISVLKEAATGETRVAATAETVKKFVALGASVSVEAGAGAGASIGDADFAAAGATIGSAADVVKDADIVLGVQGPSPAALAGAKPGAWIVAGLDQARDLADREAADRRRRLGAQVSATDVRSATKEQIESLGAKAIFVEAVKGIEGEGSGGYATEMSDEYKAAQAELVSAHIAKQDIVITTALIPGRPAPRLISDAQIASMKPGSVIFDLAVAQGGNVEGSVADEIVVKHGVKIIGYSNTPAHLPADASALFARNLYNFLSAFWDKDAGKPVLPDDDEITAAIRLTQGGKVVNTRLLEA